MTQLDIILFWYTLIFALFMTGSALSKGFAVSNLLLLALFLPITCYTALQGVKRYYQWRAYQADQAHIHPTTVSLFSLRAFLTQKHPLFVITLILFIVTCLVTILRLTSMR
jgi:hypothetical protein